MGLRISMGGEEIFIFIIIITQEQSNNTYLSGSC